MEANNKAVVEIRDVSFKYGDRLIIDHLSLNIPRGKVIAIMGGSGCGKTTLLNLIGGRIKPDSGSLIVDGLSVPDLSKKELFTLRKRMACCSSPVRC